MQKIYIDASFSTEEQITSQDHHFRDVAPVSTILSGHANNTTK